MASSAPIKLGAKGAGTMVFSNGDSYTGQWQSSRRHGDGQMQYAADGSIYDGQWCSGQRHGSAVLTGADGSTHTGGWQDDLMHGPGVQVTAAGTKLEGSWSQGDLEGDVSFTIRDASGTAQYKAGSLLAAGGGVAVEYFNGDRYNGDFSITSGIRHGQGLFLAVNGDRYDGQWDSDLRSGAGEQVCLCLPSTVCPETNPKGIRAIRTGDPTRATSGTTWRPGTAFSPARTGTPTPAAGGTGSSTARGL
jgi:hypothetical protein